MEPGSRPNLFIVGAPKCGTTALYSCLSKHPDIFMSRRKELHFFANDTCGHQRAVTSLADYLTFFEEGAGRRILGEASTTYLGSRQAAQAIKIFSPDARIIVMLRNPVDVMYAEHSERVFSGGEHIVNFERAVDSQALRSWEWGPFRGEQVNRPRYRELANFSRPLQRYLNLYGKDHVHVVIYDDFASDPAQVFDNVLAFLGVPLFPCHVERLNSNRKLRSRGVQRWLRNAPPFIKSGAQLLPAAIRRSIGTQLFRFNTSVQARAQLNKEVRNRLGKECEDDLQQLSRLIGRNLLGWIESG